MSKMTHSVKKTPQTNKKTNHKNKPNKRRTTKKSPSTKTIGLHPKNLHQGRYDFERLEAANPALSEFVILNPRGEKTVNFSNPKAVLSLNESLLKAYYGLNFWQIPEGYLCPPIPGRADYIHNLADLIDNACDVELKAAIARRPSSINVLDVGCGANCIYPIIGSQSYGWHFVGCDINPIAISMGQFIVQNNKNLKGKIKFRQQKTVTNIFDGVINRHEQFVLTLCNPPFHESMDAAAASATRKLTNLAANKCNPQTKSRKKEQGSALDKPVLNFAGVEQELCCKGGEIAFLTQMVKESAAYANQVCWFSSLVSKQENVPLIKAQLKQLGVSYIKEVPMAQGQKNSRCIVWSFFTPKEQRQFLAEIVGA